MIGCEREIKRGNAKRGEFISRHAEGGERHIGGGVFGGEIVGAFDGFEKPGLNATMARATRSLSAMPGPMTKRARNVRIEFGERVGGLKGKAMGIAAAHRDQQWSARWIWGASAQTCGSGQEATIPSRCGGRRTILSNQAHAPGGHVDNRRHRPPAGGPSHRRSPPTRGTLAEMRFNSARDSPSRTIANQNIRLAGLDEVVKTTPDQSTRPRTLRGGSAPAHLRCR